MFNFFCRSVVELSLIIKFVKLHFLFCWHQRKKHSSSSEIWTVCVHWQQAMTAEHLHSWLFMCSLKSNAIMKNYAYKLLFHCLVIVPPNRDHCFLRTVRCNAYYFRKLDKNPCVSASWQSCLLCYFFRMEQNLPVWPWWLYSSSLKCSGVNQQWKNRN